VFYWLITMTVLSWSFAMLYIYSWKNSWAGKTGVELAAKTEEKELRARIQALEEMEAPDADILDLRVKLAQRLMQSDKQLEARDVLTDGEARLLKQKSPEGSALSTLLRRAELNRLAAIACRQAGLYKFAAEKYDLATKLLAGADNRDAIVRFSKLALLNDQAVLEYIWANASKDGGERKKHFVAAEGKFQKCLAECRFCLSETEGDKSQSGSAEFMRCKRLARLSASNWAELLKDLGRGDEIEAINKMANEPIKRGA